MKIDEIKDMLPQKPERMETVAEPKRQKKMMRKIG